MRKYIKHILIGLGIIIAVVLIAVLVRNYYHEFIRLFDTKRDLHNLLAILRNYTATDVAIFSLLMVVVAAIPGAPASIFAIAAGICFGRLLGSVVSAIGISLGNLIDVIVLTLIADQMKTERHNRFIDAIINMRHPRIGLAIGYAVPVIPSFMTSLAAIRMKISNRDTLLCIVAGSTPIAVIYAFGGDQLMHQHWTAGGLTILLAVALIGLVVVLFVDKKKRDAA